MTKVVIDMSMSLDGFVAGPDDGKADPLGRHGGEHVFDWYFSGNEEWRHPVFRPEPGVNRDEVDADVRGERRVHLRAADLRDRERVGRPPPGERRADVRAHAQPPADFPRGPSNLTFVTDGIESAIRQARVVGGRQGCEAGRHGAREAGAGGRVVRRDHRPPRALSGRAAACGCSTRCRTASGWRSCRSATGRSPHTSGTGCSGRERRGLLVVIPPACAVVGRRRISRSYPGPFARGRGSYSAGCAPVGHTSR